MRFHAFAIAAVFLSVASPSHANGVAKAALSADQREQIAIRAVTQKVEKWVPHNQKLIVRGSLTSFAGNPNNPITGDGPITVYVKQKMTEGSPLKKFFHKLSPYANRQFEVNVDANGDASILQMHSLAPQAKLARAIGRVLPVSQIAHDVVTTNKTGELVGWLTGAAGMAAAAPATSGVSLAGAGAATVKAIGVVSNAVKEQRTARTLAFQKTLTWINKGGPKGGRMTVLPTLGQAYQRYVFELQGAAPGARPVDLKQFALQLSANSL